MPRSARRSAVSCPLCGWGGKRFEAAGRNGRPNARCPRCQSLERHRAAFLYLRDETDLLKPPARILHFAPERSLASVLEGISGLEYVSTDLEMPGVSLHMDIERLLFRDGVFDLVICSHVLEHVSDDLGAMREIARVLNDTGVALIMVPQLANPRDRTVEDPSIATPQERERAYGQADHVRAYGHDFADRVEAAGMTAETVTYPQRLGEEAIRRFGLTADERMFICRPISDGSSSAVEGAGTERDRAATPRRRRPFVRTISPRDSLARAERLPDYYRVGLEALRIVEDTLGRLGAPSPSTIFDCGSGYGRVTRMLRMGFPEALVECWDRDPAASEFCEGELGAKAAPPSPLEAISLPRSYELIWSASLLTQLDRERGRTLLDVLEAHTKPGGVLILTVSGPTIASLIAESRITPAIDPGAIRPMLDQFGAEGFAHQAYLREQDHGYGISLVSPQWIARAIEKRPELELISHDEAGWDGRQDVVSCRRLQRP